MGTTHSRSGFLIEVRADIIVVAIPREGFAVYFGYERRHSLLQTQQKPEQILQ